MGLQGTPTLEELKLRYYELLIRYHEHQVGVAAHSPSSRCKVFVRAVLACAGCP